jgi:hypothetical protein
MTPSSSPCALKLRSLLVWHSYGTRVRSSGAAFFENGRKLHVPEVSSTVRLRFYRDTAAFALTFVASAACSNSSGPIAPVARTSPTPSASASPTPRPTATATVSAPPQATATPTPVPTATPTAMPSATANAFTYAGSLAQTFTIYGTPGPAVTAPATAAPTATPWVTAIQTTVVQAVSATSGATFGSVTGLTDIATSETDTTVHTATTSAAHAYVALVADATRIAGIDVTDIGTTSSESSGVSYSTTFGSGNGIVEELPPVPYANWVNNAARTATERDPGGQVTTSAYAGPGTYTENISYPEENGTAQAVTYSDGSGVYQAPVEGQTQQTSTITVNAPVVAASGNSINVGYSVYGAGFPEAGGFTIPDWYPATPPVLASDDFVDEGPATVPSTCNVAAAYAAGTADAFIETKSRLDTLFGELETDSNTVYVSPQFGVLCTVASEDLKNFYDFSVQSSSLFSFSSTPIYETTVTETLGLTTAGVSGATASARAARIGAARPSFMAMPSLAHVRALLAQSRLRMLHALRARALKGGVRS